MILENMDAVRVMQVLGIIETEIVKLKDGEQIVIDEKDTVTSI